MSLFVESRGFRRCLTIVMRPTCSPSREANHIPGNTMRTGSGDLMCGGSAKIGPVMLVNMICHSLKTVQISVPVKITKRLDKGGVKTAPMLRVHCVRWSCRSEGSEDKRTIPTAILFVLYSCATCGVGECRRFRGGQELS